MAAFYTALISALYDKQYGWPALARALHDAERGDGSWLLSLADSYNGRRADGSYDNINEVIGVILCDDREDAIPSFADYAAEYHRDVGAVPVPRRLRGEHGARVRSAPPPPARG